MHGETTIKMQIFVCGADDISFYFRFMLMSIFLLDLLFCLFGWVCFSGGVYFIINDLVYFIARNITLNLFQAKYINL
jgi:hypothetical protein